MIEIQNVFRSKHDEDVKTEFIECFTKIICDIESTSEYIIESNSARGDSVAKHSLL